MIYHYLSLHLFTAKNQTKIYHYFHFYSNNFILFYSQFSQIKLNIFEFYNFDFIYLTYYWDFTQPKQNQIFLPILFLFTFFIKIIFIFIFSNSIMKIPNLYVTSFCKQKRKF